MTHWSGIAVVIASLVVAAWCGIDAARDRTLGRVGLIGLALVEVFVVIHAGYGVAGLIGGHHPHQYLVYLLYLLTFVAVVPFGLYLSKMEPTRWGTVIVAVACLVDAALITLLSQLWSGSA